MLMVAGQEAQSVAQVVVAPQLPEMSVAVMADLEATTVMLAAVVVVVAVRGAMPEMAEAVATALLTVKAVRVSPVRRGLAARVVVAVGVATAFGAVLAVALGYLVREPMGLAVLIQGARVVPDHLDQACSTVVAVAQAATLG